MPNSTGESGPSSGVVGLAVLGQIVAVVCAARFPVHARRKAIPTRIPLKYFRYSVVGVAARMFDLTQQSWRCSKRKNRNKYSRNRTPAPPDWFCVGRQIAWLGIEATNRGRGSPVCEACSGIEVRQPRRECYAPHSVPPTSVTVGC
jgi:hypothetical protein